MKYTEEQIEFILEKKPELKVKPVPNLDDVIVEFLKRYEVFVTPMTTGSSKFKRDITAGAITGLAGADVGGEAFIISGQNKQTKVQEWTQWKQWALDHKDFEAFRVEKIDKPKAHNATIEEKLNDPIIRKEFEPIFEEWRKKEEEEEKENEKYENLLKMIGIPFSILLFLVIGYAAYTSNDDSTSYKPIIRSEKIDKLIS